MTVNKTQMMAVIEAWLRRNVPSKELGWPEIGEKFTRWTLLHTPWFRIYLHKLNCLQDPVVCHDHPWHFWTVILRLGYFERIGSVVTYRRPGNVLYRPARHLHSVWTVGDAWSLLLVSPRVRQWRNHVACRD